MVNWVNNGEGDTLFMLPFKRERWETFHHPNTSSPLQNILLNTPDIEKMPRSKGCLQTFLIKCEKCDKKNCKSTEKKEQGIKNLFKWVAHVSQHIYPTQETGFPGFAWLSLWHACPQWGPRAKTRKWIFHTSCIRSHLYSVRKGIMCHWIGSGRD